MKKIIALLLALVMVFAISLLKIKYKFVVVYFIHQHADQQCQNGKSSTV